VNLISGHPQPNHPVHGPGFATITATTADENEVTISKDIIVLFSGISEVNVNPTSFDMQNGGSQLFTYYVGDENGNPLVGGTNISVTADGKDMNIQGDISFSLPDTQSPAWTQFSFRIYDSQPDSAKLVPASVTVTATGANGFASQTVYGQKR
jgi:hypothetical protein